MWVIHSVFPLFERMDVNDDDDDHYDAAYIYIFFCSIGPFPFLVG